MFVEGVALTAPSPPGAMQTPEAGSDAASTVSLQSAVPAPPAVAAQQQVPVQQQVSLAPLFIHPSVRSFISGQKGQNIRSVSVAASTRLV